MTGYSENPPTGSSRRIADLSDDDRPREKALAHGIRSLSNAELLAIIFGGGLPGKSVVEMSREILSACDNKLVSLARMPIQAVARSFRGIGPAKAIALAAAFELGSRCRDEERSRDVTVRSSDDAFNYIRGRLENLDHEEFWVLVLSRANRILSAELVSRGGTTATVVDVKIVVKTAVDRLAAGVILVHNHPSGNRMPSVQDDALTSRIKDAAALFDIRVLDHLIVAGNEYCSYADNGKI
ncbi:MAG: DNA repair protein RadC [Paramuribaculum sp.]|nr:DNA repair protein RadC [Paramuribaculum sp.]